MGVAKEVGSGLSEVGLVVSPLRRKREKKRRKEEGGRRKEKEKPLSISHMGEKRTWETTKRICKLGRGVLEWEKREPDLVLANKAKKQ